MVRNPRVDILHISSYRGWRLDCEIYSTSEYWSWCCGMRNETRKQNAPIERLSIVPPAIRETFHHHHHHQRQQLPAAKHAMVSSMPEKPSTTTPPEEVVVSKEKDRNEKAPKRKRRPRRRLVKFHMDDNTEHSYPCALYNANYVDLYWGDEEMDSLQEETALFVEEIRNRGETAYTEALEGLIVSELEDPENLNMSKTVTRSPTRGFESYFSPIILKLQKACVDEVLEAQRKMKNAQSSSERKEREKTLAKVSKQWSHELRMFAHKKALGDFMLAMKIHKESRDEKKPDGSRGGRGKVRPSREQALPKDSQQSVGCADSKTNKQDRALFLPPKPPPFAKSPRMPSSARKSPRSERKSTLRDYSTKSPQPSHRKSAKDSLSSRDAKGFTITKDSGHSLSKEFAVVPSSIPSSSLLPTKASFTSRKSDTACWNACFE